jgi:hypothetical protein
MIFCFRVPAPVECFGVIAAVEDVLHIPATSRVVGDRPHHAGFRHVGFDPLKHGFRVIGQEIDSIGWHGLFAAMDASPLRTV